MIRGNLDLERRESRSKNLVLGSGSRSPGRCWLRGRRNSRLGGRRRNARLGVVKRDHRLRDIGGFSSPENRALLLARIQDEREALFLGVGLHRIEYFGGQGVVHLTDSLLVVVLRIFGRTL